MIGDWLIGEKTAVGGQKDKHPTSNIERPTSNEKNTELSHFSGLSRLG